MKVLQVTAPRTFSILDLPIPEPGPGQVRLKVLAVTTCPQWDLHLRHNEPMFVGHQFHYPYTPGQPGHEASGVVDAIGAGVTSLQVGDRVSAWRDAGHKIPGCYAQYVLHLEDNLIRVPAQLSPVATAPLELAMCMGTVFRQLRGMNALAGKRVGIGGLGPAGLIALQMAKAEGATTVIGFDLVAERRALALQLGAAECYDPTGTLPAELPARPQKRGLDVSVDCVGGGAIVRFLLDHTEDAVALFGVQREDYTYARGHGPVSIIGYKGHFRESAQYAVDLLAAGKLNLAPLVTHELPLERYGEAIDLLENRQAIKVCFKPWD
jgi:threonine dehydrogenase-like Zn-dependent dehydrogenase